MPFIPSFQHGVLQSTKMLNGHEESELYLYEPNRYPLGFVCPVRCSFEVSATDTLDEGKRVCWIWCHPSAFLAVIDRFKSIAKNHDIVIRDESRQFVRYELRGPMSSFVLQAASHCQIPVLMEKDSESVIGDGDCFTSTLPIHPKLLSVAQPFILNDKATANRKAKSFQFRLKQDFIGRHSPLQHPSVLVQQGKACSQVMNHHFHCHFEDAPDSEEQFPFKMVARRFYQSNAKWLGHKIVGWDVIVPVHAEPKRASFWWNNLHFAGGRVIGMDQKLAMRLEMTSKGRRFPVDYLDSNISVHYWLKYRKYGALKEYFKRPKSKRPHSFPKYPFAFWPNVLNLIHSDIENMTMAEEAVASNLKAVEQSEKSVDNNKMDAESSSSMKSAHYTLNHTLFGLKHDCNLMHHISAKLHLDRVDKFGGEWIKDPKRKYFIMRNVDILRRIKAKESMHSMMSKWNGTALINVDIVMCSKGVPAAGNALFANGDLCGYVVDGAYSSIEGKGIGFGLVIMDKVAALYRATNHKLILNMKGMAMNPHQHFQCYVDVSM